MWARIGLSLLIVWHLFAVLLAPNMENYLGVLTAPVTEPYLSFFELTNQWSFFAPDPGPPPIFLEWEIGNGQGEITERGSLPDPGNPFFLRERQNRRIAVAAFMLTRPDWMDKILVKKICKDHPGAVSVSIWRKLYSNPGLQEILEKKVSPGDESLAKREHVLRSYCDSAGKDS